jgi:3-carboxy-cis,cis-muconate cycloisomerase
MSSLIDSLATTDALDEIFSDASMLRGMLDFEASLAVAEAHAGLISHRAAHVIASAAQAGSFDAASIARAARESGTVSIPLVNALADRVRSVDRESASYVHWGATSQDVADTALVLALIRARDAIAADHLRLDRALRELSDRHAQTVMLGRTLLQPAPPITFGLKTARYVAALARGWKRADAAFADNAMLQFGGASGTLASLGGRGLEIAQMLADALRLTLPAASWHTDRDRLGALVSALAVYTATVGKIAHDIALLMQDEVGEAAEPGGGSSAMPHKRNPSRCAAAMAAATRMPGLTAAYLTGMLQEHERAVGGWHAEWPSLAAIVKAAGAAVQALAEAVEKLTVNPARMRANIERTNGAVFTERVIALVTPKHGKEAAQALVKAALTAIERDGVTLREALTRLPDAASLLTPDDIRSIDVPEDYLGAAEPMRIALLRSADL